jgi:hypothetical protein
MTAIRTSKQQIQNRLWMGCGLLCLLIAGIAWTKGHKSAEEITAERQPEAEVVTHIQPEKVEAMTHLGALMNEVKPLDLTTRVVASGNHEPEFRGNKFVEDNKNKYVIELFRVSEEDIVNIYLKKQLDRKVYRYIRLSGADQAEQYVVLYGLYANEAEAKTALSQLNLNLPESVKPHLQQIKGYQAFVNDLGSDELGSAKKLYSVRLRPVALPRPDAQVMAQARRQVATTNQLQKTPAQVQNHASSTTTTITRRDQSGNVVSVEQH